MDEGDTIEGCAKRELLEETGLVADKVIYKDDGSWVVSTCPFMDNNMSVCTISQVDGDLKKNKERIQNLGHKEMIKVFELDFDVTFVD